MSFLLLVALATSPAQLETARDRQDRPALERALAELAAAVNRQPNDANAQYRVAVANSYLSEVALEMRDKSQARQAAEAGIQAAEKAVALSGSNAEYHRLLGTLCGQIIPAHLLSALSYGRCARDEINRALELDPRSAMAHVSRGVGNYYLPPSFGGGVDAALRDFEKAVQLNPKLAEAWLWLGIARRKAGRNKEAREALSKSLQLNPQRIWTKQQLDKTPAQ